MVCLVLLGAGASFGSEDAYFQGNQPRKTPPLGKDLFSEIEKHSLVARAIPTGLKKVFLENFETGMACYEGWCGNSADLQRDIALYLASYVPGRKNLYIELIRRLTARAIPVVFSTLNYDLLFDYSCVILEKTPRYTLMGSGDIPFLKIHGSSNFVVSPDYGIRDVWGVHCAATVDVPLTAIKDQYRILAYLRDQHNPAPAIAVFREGKPVRTSPSAIASLQQEWQDTASSADYILCAGARIHRPDSHIWDVIGRSKAKFIYCGFSGDHEDFSSLTKSYPNLNAQFVIANFAKAIDVFAAELPAR